MVPGNPLAFIFVAEQPLLLCHRKAEATRPHAGALRQSLRPSPKVALSRGWEPRCPADQDEELLLHPGGGLAACSRFLAGREQAAVGAAGIEFQGWQGQPAEAREGVLSGRCISGRRRSSRWGLWAAAPHGRDGSSRKELPPFLLLLSRPRCSSFEGRVSL